MQLTRFVDDTKSTEIVKSDPEKRGRWFSWQCVTVWHVKVNANKCKAVCLGIYIFSYILYFFNYGLNVMLLLLRNSVAVG